MLHVAKLAHPPSSLGKCTHDSGRVTDHRGTSKQLQWRLHQGVDAVRQSEQRFRGPELGVSPRICRHRSLGSRRVPPILARQWSVFGSMRGESASRAAPRDESALYRQQCYPRSTKAHPTRHYTNPKHEGQRLVGRGETCSREDLSHIGGLDDPVAECSDERSSALHRARRCWANVFTCRRADIAWSNSSHLATWVCASSLED